jgi:PKD repeat protein
MFKGQAHPLKLRRLFHMLVSLSFLTSLAFINVQAARADDVCGPIDINTTWTLASSPYIVTCSVLVMNGYTLTIEPGVTVKFNGHKALQVDGELIAIGTSESPITFTSNVGTNPGDWDYIVFSPTSIDAVYDVNGDYVSGSIMKHVIIEYAGGSSLANNNGTLRLDAASPYITYTTIRKNANNGIMGFHQPTTLKMTHNTIADNIGTGIYVDATYTEITDSIIASNISSASSLGGGIRISTGTSLISRNIIRGNIQQYNISAIEISGSSATISDNIITENAIANCNPCWGNKALHIGGNQATVSNNLIAYNFIGGISADAYSLTIVDNIIIHNQGIALENLWTGTGTISHNILADNINGVESGALRVGWSTDNINHNSIVRNIAQNSAALVYFGADLGSAISANTFVGNVNQSAPPGLRSVSIQGHPTFNDNNIYNNIGYALYNQSPQGSANLNAENNWWGTSSNSAIQALIYDWFDDSALGIVDYSPFRTTWNPDAPVSPPTGFVVTSGFPSLNLSWVANPESDVIGYKIYYGTDGKYPYSGTGADQGASPIDVGNVLTYTLTGLPDGLYHLTITAYDASADGVHDQTDGNESWLSVDDTGTVGELPQAKFSATPTSGIAPLTVNFTNESSGDYDTCRWNFGDGGASSECAGPVHIYETHGVFTVTLMVTGFVGTDTETKPGYITIYEPTQADFSGSPTSGVAPLSVAFTNLSSGEYDTCSWDFGNGGTSSDCTIPGNIYNDSGVYTVSLTVSGLGGTDTETKTDYIKAYMPTVANFNGTPTSGVAPLSVAFTNLSSGNYDTCSWNFGDGGTSSDCNDPGYVYNDSGVYTVSLTVSGLGGTDTETKTGYIEVYASAVANFNGAPTNGVAPLSVSFTNLSSGNYDSCEWDFGDGGTFSSCSNSTYIYQLAGVYTVTLTVNGLGGSDELIKPAFITVNYAIILPLILR